LKELQKSPKNFKWSEFHGDSVFISEFLSEDRVRCYSHHGRISSILSNTRLGLHYNAL